MDDQCRYRFAREGEQGMSRLGCNLEDELDPYLMGCFAFAAGNKDCPFGRGNDKRKSWWQGYFASRSNDRLGYLLEKWNGNVR